MRDKPGTGKEVEIKALMVYALLISLIWASTAYAQEPIGIVTAVKGQVTVAGATGVMEAVEEGARVFLGDRFKTEENSGVKILLNDDTLVSLGGETDFEITEFVYTPNARRSLSNIFKGKLKAIIQKFEGRESNVEFAAPNGVIGIKGTIIFIDADKGIFYVDEGRATVRGITKEVVLEAGQFTIIGPDGNPLDPKSITPELRKGLEDATEVKEEAPPRDSLYKEDYPGKEPPPPIITGTKDTSISDMPTVPPVDLLPGTNGRNEAPVDITIPPPQSPLRR
jgi:hypothetical protein